MESHTKKLTLATTSLFPVSMDLPVLEGAFAENALHPQVEAISRGNAMEESSILKTFSPGNGDEFHYNVTQRSQRFLSFLNSKTPTQRKSHTVVLHGPAGVGKTTLAKKCMLDWTQDNLAQTCPRAFYLSCKVLSRKGTCSFAQVLAESAPDLQDALPQVLAQAQKLLFVIDAFEELRVPSGVGALVHDLCGDWRTQRPAPVLLGSLLKRKLLPTATLLVTTRPEALRELRFLVERPLLVEMEGLSERDRRAYFLRHFGEEARALRAFHLMKSNAALFRMGAAPAVCWMVCTCLRLQMDEAEDPRPTCQTATSLLLCFLCSRFAPVQGSCPGPHLAAALRALCLLAAEGTWAQTSVFDGHDLRRLGMDESDLRPFLDTSILQKGRDCEGCYCFVHLSVQQFLAAALYVLGSEDHQDAGSPGWNIGGVQRLLSKEEGLKNPHLAPVGRFLFGLANEKRARELGTTFGCPVSTEVKQELLECRIRSAENRPFSSVTDTKEILYCLYESQEELLVKEAMAQVTEVSLHLQDTSDMVHAAFCLKHCENLQKIRLRVEKGMFLENDAAWESEAQADRSQHDHVFLHLWIDLCSVFSSNENLCFLDVSQSFLSHSSVRILCEQITRVTCHLQKLVIKNVSPADAYRDLCLALVGKKTLTHLVLEGGVHSDKLLLLLCETLRHPRCNLRYLRLGSCSDTTQQWADFSSALEVNQSLKCLDLTASELPDECTKLLCMTLRHPKCFLQRLLLENCHLAEACCKELSSALIVNQRLTHLCLANNNLGDGGVKLLCEGLSYPDCQLQNLVLSHCNITRRGCRYISKLLQEDSSLTNLDLGLNPIATGSWFLCEALKKPNCNLRCLGLCGCSITSSCCQGLASVLISTQRLETLDLGQNILGQSGITVLFEALKQNNSPLKILRLEIDESSVEIQKLLKDVKDHNPNLTIECSDAKASLSPCCEFLS
ncbi:NACHT, LRR and PYD domains-containing protein 2 [Zalophus californianus]|uniref:NACHT, LRR and PYD domains-containing protein 2 n=1 Tax=Zalophus californianus TaxID=9704 RepID=A0A6P9F4H6_ZALCA|nr:NACHT, LRR and PYD domains-containing protein 2 [Zalophus californianus]